MKNSALSLTTGLLLVASVSLASNTAFKLSYTIKAPAGVSNTNIVSLPYYYFPDGVVGNPQDSKKLCLSVNDGQVSPPRKVAQVSRFDPLTDIVRSQSCAAAGGPIPPTFVLTAGQAYTMKPAGSDQVIIIIGSMDDRFAKPPHLGGSAVTLRAGSGNVSRNNWVSVPYHVRAADSKALCLDVNDGTFNPPPKVLQIGVFDVNTDLVRTQSCAAAGGPVPPAFRLTPGMGYIFKPAVDNAQINFDVY